MFDLFGRTLRIFGAVIGVILWTAKASFATCVANQVPTQDIGFGDLFFSVGGVSATDVWAVGDETGLYNIKHSLSEHWDGSVWTIVRTPIVRGYSNGLDGVAAFSSTNVWAVGSLSPNRGGGAAQTLSLHWNGLRWSVVPTPTTAGRFNAAAPVKQNGDVWAAGTADVSRAPSQPLIELWIGSTWSVMSTTTFPNGGSVFGVTSPSPKSAWAAGQAYDASANYFPFTLHWNGNAWTQVTAQLVGADSTFEAIAALSDRDAWAGGYYYDATGNRFPGLIEHWDGIAWTVVPIPNPPFGDMVIYAISALSSTNVWASGYMGPGVQGMLLHWDGTQWTLVPTPHPTGTDELFSVAAFPYNVWSVGATSSSGVERTLSVISHC